MDRGSLRPARPWPAAALGGHALRGGRRSAALLSPKLEGRVEVKFVIDERGKVSCATGERSALPDPAVVACVVDGFRKLTFPPPRDGRLTVVYPINFSSVEGSADRPNAP